MHCKKLIVIRTLLAVLLVANMAVIFWSSAQNASQSSRLSGGLTEKLMELGETHKKPAPQTTAPQKPSQSDASGVAETKAPVETKTPAGTEAPAETESAEHREMRHRAEVRKNDDKLRFFAHMGEFMTLGALSAFLLYSFKKGGLPVLSSTLLAAVFGMLYALSDEVHQIFVDGRSFEWCDVGIDSLGCVIGIAAALTIYLFAVLCAKTRNAKRR